ncbi:MAG: hypothetical protein ACR2OV_08845 [Hyphomicrobiaceae bacterium]
MRIVMAISVTALAALAGCAAKPQLSPQEIAKLKGGTTTVVVYGFCAPIDHLVKTALTRYTLTYEVNGKSVGTMQSCSYAKFQVPSGYWSSKFVRAAFLAFPHSVPRAAFRPGKTQYLHMVPTGNSTFSGRWVSKAKADNGIAAIKKIGQVF